MSEVMVHRQPITPTYAIPVISVANSTQFKHPESMELKEFKINKQEKADAIRPKRKYEKKPKILSSSVALATQQSIPAALPIFNVKDMNQYDFPSSDEEPLSHVLSGSSEVEEENDPDGPFAFHRKAGCQYYAPHLEQTGDWLWNSPKGRKLGDEHYRYCLTTLTVPHRCIGFSRRRVGRGLNHQFKERVDDEALSFFLLRSQMCCLINQKPGRRYNLGDYNGEIMSEVMVHRHAHNFTYAIPVISVANSTQFKHPESMELKEFKINKQSIPAALPIFNVKDMNQSDFPSSDEEPLSHVLSGSSEVEEENDPDGPFAFHRKAGCQYYAPHLEQTGDWLWNSPKGRKLGDEHYRYCLTTLTVPHRCIGFSRRRVGRGGRYNLGDYNGEIMSEVMVHRQPITPTYAIPVISVANSTHKRKLMLSTKEKYEKKPKILSSSVALATQQSIPAALPIFNVKDMNQYDFPSSDEEPLSHVLSGSSEVEEENDPDGPFAFHRKQAVSIYAVSFEFLQYCIVTPHLEQTGDWLWNSPKGRKLGDEHYRYCLTTLTVPHRCIGFSRGRVGRGG
ncbi:putative Enhancer of polycomb-like protein, partial [Naja naja]